MTDITLLLTHTKCIHLTTSSLFLATSKVFRGLGTP